MLMADCREIYLNSYGDKFDKGDYSYDKIRKALEKARSK